MALEGGPGELGTILAKQKAAHLRDGIPSVEKRIDWLDRSIDLLATHGDKLNEAMREDFGHRSVDQSNFTDIAGSIGALKHAKKHVKSWMKPEKRSTDFPLGLFGAKALAQRFGIGNPVGDHRVGHLGP